MSIFERVDFYGQLNHRESHDDTARGFFSLAATFCSLWVVITLAPLIGCAPSDTEMRPDQEVSGLSPTARPQTRSPVGALQISLGDIQRICPVTLISSQIALTAARCIQGINTSAMRIYFEEAVDTNFPAIQVNAVLIHPLYMGVNSAIDGLLLEELRAGRDAALDEVISYDLAVLQLQEASSAEQLSPVGANLLPEAPGFSVNISTYELVGTPSLLARQVEDSVTVDGIYPTLIRLPLSPAARGFCTSGAGTPILAAVDGRPTVLAVGTLASCEVGAGLYTRLDVHSAFIQDALAGAVRDREVYRIDREAGP
ncbi:MAG: hypothetical protein VYD19_02725, partial [Myxococcota bacterium]|nr:hypothetical protein [Myxococcota bacterium]